MSSIKASSILGWIQADLQPPIQFFQKLIMKERGWKIGDIQLGAGWEGWGLPVRQPHLRCVGDESWQDLILRI